MARNTQLHINSKTSNQNNGHILVISSPFQGHVAPLLKLCHRMITSGTKVMFLTMDYIRAGMISSSSKGSAGMPLKDGSIQLLPNMPPMSKKEFTWYFPSDINIQKEIFHVTKGIIHHLKNVDWIICNWFNDLEPSATKLMPNLLPVGPLLANGHSAGSFCLEDSTCLNWLDRQPQNSVLYVAFGSTTRFSKEQLDELAAGLEQTGRPFLWVAWSGLSDGAFHPYLSEFRERIGVGGKIVEWAPQEVVLGHPSIACFVTHCGWSSFLESLSMGVPFLCWPYFGDQLYTQSCICEGWKVGLILEGDESGVVQSSEIVKKVDRLLCDEVIKGNSKKWKEMAVKSISEGGSSLVNLEHALEHLKGY